MCFLTVMTNYDFNKGYRGFRFEKHLSIDDSQPALSSYRSAREKNSIVEILNTQRGNATQCQVLGNHSHSLPKSTRLSTAVASGLPNVEEHSYLRALSKRSEETKTSFLAISQAPFQSQKKRHFPIYRAVKVSVELI